MYRTGRLFVRGQESVTPPVVLARVTMLVVFVFFLVSGTAGVDNATAQVKTQEPSTTPGKQATEAEKASEPPDLGAKSWALADAESGLYLAGKNPDERLPIASTTKIMVALVALDEGVDLDEQVVVSEKAESYVGFTYSNVGLIQGERLSVRDLLVAALVPSGTDAVYALAEHLGDGSVDEFVEKMNDKADSMGLENTRFENPAGLDDPGNYSSARDLTKIARAATKYQAFRDIVSMREATIKTQNRKIEIFNTNSLLSSYPEATGIKTGTSPKAGPCLVSSAEDGDESYVAVVLDAADEEERFEAAQEALEYGFDNYQRRALINEEEAYGKITLPYRPDESVRLGAAEEVSGLVGPGIEVERRVKKDEPPPEAKAGQELGEVEVLVEGRKAGSSALVAQKGYEEACLWRKAVYTAGGLLKRVQRFVGGLTE